MNEFDYRTEAENLRAVKRLIEEGKFADRVKIPEPKVELCSKNVLFMEEIEGVPLALGVKESYERFLKAIGRKEEDANAMMRRSADASLKNEKRKDVEETTRATRKANAMIRAKFLLIDEPIRLAYNLSPLRLVYGKSEKKTFRDACQSRRRVANHVGRSRRTKFLSAARSTATRIRETFF